MSSYIGLGLIYRKQKSRGNRILRPNAREYFGDTGVNHEVGARIVGRGLGVYDDELTLIAVEKARRAVDEILHVGILRVKNAQRIRVETALRVVVEHILIRFEIGDQRLAVTLALILRAEGEKRSAILTAEGDKEAMVLRATAKKEAMIAEAEGQAQATERLYEAQAKGIQMIKDADPNKSFLTLKSLETYGKMADGKATKIVVPAQLQDLATLLTSAKEFLSDPSDAQPKE